MKIGWFVVSVSQLEGKVDTSMEMGWFVRSGSNLRGMLRQV